MDRIPLLQVAVYQTTSFFAKWAGDACLWGLSASYMYYKCLVVSMVPEVGSCVVKGIVQKAAV